MQARLLPAVRCAAILAMAPTLTEASATGMEDFTGDFTQVFGSVHVDPWHKASCSADVEGCAHNCHHTEGCVAFQMAGARECNFLFEPRADLGGVEPEALAPSEGTYVLKTLASATDLVAAQVETAEAAGARLRGGVSSGATSAAEVNAADKTVSAAQAPTQEAAKEPQPFHEAAAVAAAALENSNGEDIVAGIPCTTADDCPLSERCCCNNVVIPEYQGVCTPSFDEHACGAIWEAQGTCV